MLSTNKYRMNVNTKKWEYWYDKSDNMHNHGWREMKECDMYLIPEDMYSVGLELRDRKKPEDRPTDYNEIPLEIPVKQAMYDYIGQCRDMHLTSSEDRVHKVANTIGKYTYDEVGKIALVKYDAWLKTYVESLRYAMQQVKNKNSSLSEDTDFAVGLEKMADYILDCDENNENQILSKNKIKNNKTRELPLSASVTVKVITDESTGESYEIEEDMRPKFKVNKKELKHTRAVNKNDLERFPELMNMDVVITHLYEKIGYGVGETKEEKDAYREKLKQEIANEFMNRSNKLSNKDFVSKERVIERPRYSEEVRDELLSKESMLRSKIEKLQEKGINDSRTHELQMQIDQCISKRIIPVEELNKVFTDIYIMKLPVNIEIGRGLVDLSTQKLGYPHYYNANTYYGKMKRHYGEIKSEMETVKEKFLAPIMFKKVSKHETVYCWDNDTGVWEDVYDDQYRSSDRFIHKHGKKLKQGDYKSLSENKLDLSDKDHISGLIATYSELNQKYKDKTDTDMWAILKDLEDVIETTELKDVQRFVLKLYLIDPDYTSISDIVTERFKEDYTYDNIAYMLTETIPSLLVERNGVIYDAYLNRIKGIQRTKKCSKCKILKFPTIRYFSPDKSKKDGLKSMCKSCRRKK